MNSQPDLHSHDGAASFRLDERPFFGRTGHGVLVAVIDSGIHTGNPHIATAVRGVHISAAGEDDDYVDRLGHGTAVAAAILEKAPGVDLFAIRVFDRALTTSAGVLARAIEWAADQGCRLINLSLGTPKQEHADALREVVDHAAARGALVVSAKELDGTHWLPGSLEGVAAVLLDPACARNALKISASGDGTVLFRASGYPRPIPGVPPERNVQGISFAVANTTGFLARLLEAEPGLRTPSDVERFLRKQVQPST